MSSITRAQRLDKRARSHTGVERLHVVDLVIDGVDSVLRSDGVTAYAGRHQAVDECSMSWAICSEPKTRIVCKVTSDHFLPRNRSTSSMHFGNLLMSLCGEIFSGTMRVATLIEWIVCAENVTCLKRSAGDLLATP